MPTTTVTFQRAVSVMKTFSNPTLGGLESAYNAYVATQMADTDFTRTVRIVNSFHDGTNFITIAEDTYPEINLDPTAQVPELP